MAAVTVSLATCWVAMAWGDGHDGVCMSRWGKEMGRVARRRMGRVARCRMERNMVIGNCTSPAGTHVTGRSEPRGKTAAARWVYGCTVS
jgi:hypothetical protein